MIAIDANQFAIGWYCPFSLPPIISDDHIKAIQITPVSDAKSYFGTIKLCRKLSLILRCMDNTSLDGLVMANCCNLAMNVYKYLTVSNPELPVFFMDMPRKVDECFPSRLISEWDRLENWMNALKNSASSGNSPDNCNNNANRYHKACLDDSVYQSAVWCQPPENLHDIKDKSLRRELIADLVNGVNCPRIIDSGLYGCYTRVMEYDMEFLINNSDSDCIIHNYFIMAVSHSNKGNCK